MNKHLFAAAAAALTLAFASGSALAQSADLNVWAKAGDVLIDSLSSARLTTAAVDSGESTLPSNSALLYVDLEPKLSLSAGTLAADTYEGSGLQMSFMAAAGTTVSFKWELTTVDYDADFADRAFAVIDGSSLVNLATVAALATTGTFSHTFSAAGSHALAFGVLDVNDVFGVSTLSISNFSVTAVPEPTSALLLLAGLAGLGLHARQRHCR